MSCHSPKRDLSTNPPVVWGFPDLGAHPFNPIRSKGLCMARMLETSRNYGFAIEATWLLLHWSVQVGLRKARLLEGPFDPQPGAVSSRFIWRAKRWDEWNVQEEVALVSEAVKELQGFLLRNLELICFLFVEGMVSPRESFETPNVKIRNRYRLTKSSSRSMQFWWATSGDGGSEDCWLSALQHQIRA